MEINEEFKRLINLSDFNLDYETLEREFIGLNQLAAKIANSEISQLNFIDNFIQWSVSQVGTTDLQTPREETICTYTVESGKPMEVKNLSKDPRFKNLEAIKVAGAKYYFGIPLISKEGFSIGSLCVISLKEIQLTEEKKELLSIIANEIVQRLEDMREISKLREKQSELEKSKREVAHDLRGMINGVTGLGDLIGMENDGQSQEIEKYVKLLKSSSSSILEYVENILTSKKEEDETDTINLKMLSKKLEKLYLPLAIKKDLDFEVSFGAENSEVQFERKTILQVIGNLVSNAMKFTPKDGRVSVQFNLIETIEVESEASHSLRIIVQDSGIGMDEQKIKSVLSEKTISTEGTSGEEGYGLGLNLIKHHVEQLKGTISIDSTPGQGSSFTILVPVH